MSSLQLKYEAIASNAYTLTLYYSPVATIGIGFAVAIPFSLVLGIALGVAGSVAAFKFMMWMKGKTLVFVPWPKIQSSG